MRIQAKQLHHYLPNYLNDLKNPSPLCILFGEEPFQQFESLELLRKHAKEQGYTEKITTELSSKTDWQHFKTVVDSFSLFSPKRLFECYFNEGSLDKKSQEHLHQIIASLTKAVFMIFIFKEKLSSAVLKSSWFRQLESRGLSIQSNPLLPNEYSAWIKNRFEKANVMASADAITCLSERTEGNLLAAAQVIEKLKLSYPNLSHSTLEKPVKIKTIEADDILALTCDDARFSLFNLADAVLSRSLKRTLHILESLKNEGVEPILVLWVLTKEVRTLIPLAKLAQNQKLTPKVLENNGVWQHRIPLITAFLNQTSLVNLYQALEQAKEIDHGIKTSKLYQEWPALKSLALFLAGVDVYV